MKQLRSIKELFVLVCLGITLALTYNNFAYTHVHQLSNGIYVNHAHPSLINTDDASAPVEHKHNGCEYFVLDQLNLNNVLSFIALVLLGALLAKLKSKAETPYVTSASSLKVFTKAGRAPPVLA